MQLTPVETQWKKKNQYRQGGSAEHVLGVIMLVI